MSQTVISVEQLCKTYRLGQIGTGTLRNDLNVWWAKKTGKPNPMLKIGQIDYGNRNGETLWALRDINFQVEQGEALGIIGRNGAGKSTLLKILSRVTAPTSGCVKVKGRIASLLEVGTGFHPELTGRENIYLNGAILGMTKEEVSRKFDEIVTFAEIEKFIDTPVKRYSSGMYVRLAFAVAAYLDPEILVVDEVLAVGDAEFQRKCLGKMGDVAKEGRTVLFVSHNMAAVRMLCTKGILIEKGSIKIIDAPEAVISRYLSTAGNTELCKEWDEVNAPGDEAFRLLKFEILQKGKVVSNNVSSRLPLEVSVDCLIENPQSALQVGFELITMDGVRIFQSFHTDGKEQTRLTKGKHKLKCSIPAGLLNEGAYIIRPMAAIYFSRWILKTDSSYELRFHSTLDHSESQLWYSARQGVLAPLLHWDIL